jgi:hypothetical protein
MPAARRIHADDDHRKKQQPIGVRDLDPEVLTSPEQARLVAKNLSGIAHGFRASLL